MNSLPHIKAMAHLGSPLRITTVYALFGALWILLTDGVVAIAAGKGARAWMMDSGKGLVFIGVTTGLLYILTRRLEVRHQAYEIALRDGEQRLALAMEAANQGLYDFNVQTGAVIVNGTFATMLGFTPANFSMDRARWMEQMHPDDRERAAQTLADYLAGRIGEYRVEFRLKTAAGGWKWVLSVGRVVERDAAGRPIRMLGTHTDITERKSAEAGTLDALAFAKAVLYSAPVGIIAYGPDGRAVIANECAARMIGAEVPDLLRQNYRELESWRSSGLLEAAERTLATGRETTHRAPLQTSFGRSLQVEAHLVPFDYRDGRHLLIIVSDETAQRQAMANLHLLHAALQASPSACLITDAEGAIEWVNPAFTSLTGYAAAEVLGQNPRMLRSERQSGEFYRQFWETIRRGEVWSGEICNRRKDGTFYDEQMTVAPVKDDDGVVRHYVAIKHDITERKQLEQQLTRTQRLESIGMLASGIAHDLNNVLTPILLSIELLKTKYPDAGAARYVDTVETAAKRGAGIVRQVLTFARGVDGGERTEVQPRYLVNDVVHLIEETFPRNIEIRHEVARDVLPVKGDLTQLHQVFLNLAVNARDAMPQGGALTLVARNLSVDPAGNIAHRQLKAGTYVALAVTDTGTGITPEVLEHMFEPFYTTKPRGKGTGLGLSTVYGIVRSHGGIIDVRTRLGQGTTFEVLLPAIAIPAAVAGTVDTRPVLKGAGRRVLVVDDEEAIRNVTTRVLARHDFVPVMAVDGTDGLRTFLASPRSFAVVIVDMLMPRMSGADLARNIHLAAPGVPVIISTGMMGDATGVDPGLQLAGVRTYLRKPYTEEELLQALARELEPGIASPPAKAKAV